MTLRRLLSATALVGVLALSACARPTSVSTSAGPIPGAPPGSATTTTTTGAAPEVAVPGSYVRKQWSSTVGGAVVKVPSGWPETVREAYWSDFVDATGQVRLRVNVTPSLTDAAPVTPKAAAEAELDRLKSASGFQLVERTELTAATVDKFIASQITYRFDRDGVQVQATFQFLGTPEKLVATLGTQYPRDAADVADGVLGAAHDSLTIGK